MSCSVMSEWMLSRIPPLILEIDKTKFKGRFVLSFVYLEFILNRKRRESCFLIT